MPRAALFDIGGTLIEGHAWNGFWHHPAVRRRRVYWLYIQTIPLLLVRRLRLLSEAAFRERWAQNLAGLLRGWPVEQADELFQWIAADFLLLQYRADVVALLQQHGDEGHAVILVSGVFSGLVERIAQHLGADVGLGSALEVRDGRLTGRLRGPTCVGPRKLESVRACLAQHHPDISLSDCAAYADSISDMPLLAATGHPTAVYPDDGLRREALRRGWTIHPPHPAHSHP